jgi:hypothetical protein
MIKAKIKIGRTYKDGVGCTVKIIHKMKSGLYPYVGILDWSCVPDSKDCEQQPETYNEYGESALRFNPPRKGLTYDLVKTVRKKK